MAVNESVSLCRALKKSSAAGLVNAVLRKAVAQDPAAATFKTEAERLSIQYSCLLYTSLHETPPPKVGKSTHPL